MATSNDQPIQESEEQIYSDGAEGMKVDGDAQISERFPLSIGGEG